MINLSMAEPDNILRPRLSVVGVGGAGGNAINNMIRSNLEGCDFIAANTDAQALAQSLAARKIQLGATLSRGLGAGSKPDMGRAAAEEQLPEIMSVLEGSDMIFVTAGMGGGTGTGAAPVIAKAARECGILTVGVVTKPFHFEGTQRMKQAERGIADLQQYVDTLIVIPNQNLFRIANERTTFAEAFRLADEVLNSGVRGITDLMVMPGFMNLDFADVKTVMGEMGKAMMGTGEAEGDNRAICAAEAAISNPLLDDISMKGARGVLINITGGLDMTLFEVDQAANRIREEVDNEAQIKVGSTLNEMLEGRIRVSVIATGIDAELEMQARQRAGQSSGVIPSVHTSQASHTSHATHTTHAAQTPQVNPVPSNSVMSRITSEAGRRAFQAAKSAAPAQQTTTAAPPAQAAATVAPAAQPAASANASYFTMPPAVNPQSMTHQTVEPEPVKAEPRYEPPVQNIEEELAAPHAVEAAHVAEVSVPPAPPQQSYSPTPAARPQPMTQSPLRASSTPRSPHQTPAAPTRNIEPAQQDMRITQIATPAPQQTGAPSQQTSHRSQSLFQRITGFGMVRPSAAREAEEALMDTMEAAEPRLSVDPGDRPTLSANTEQTDLLDIPAFLRRQTNH